MPSVRVGVTNVHIAIMTNDSTSGAAYEAPELLDEVISVDKKTASSKAPMYANNGPAEIVVATGETTVSINTTELTLAQKAKILGHKIVGGVMEKNIEDIPPYLAIMFEGLKNNGKKRYVKLLKGMAIEPDENFKTKGGTAEGQTDTIEITFVRRNYDNLYERVADEEHPDYVASIGANWYNAVDTDADTTAPTVACTPADSATNVAAASTVVLTFNEAISASTLVAGESFVLQKNDGTQVAGSGTWNTGHTVYTFTPSANLTAGATYNAIVTKAVKDLAGNALAAVNEFTFTVAA